MSNRWNRAEIAALVLLVAVVVTVAALWRPASPPEAAQPPHEPQEMASFIAPLTGVTIAIDPGHGGYDQGCEGRAGTLEAPLNLDVSLRLGKALQELGARVVFTRQEDVSLVDKDAPGNRKQQDMRLREAVIQEAGAQILLSIHMNAYAASSAPSGALVYYTQGNEEGKALAQSIQAAFHEWNGRHKQNPHTGDYYILRACEASVLVECGFLTNPREEALLSTADYRQELAQVIAQGVLAYWQPLR